MVLDKIFRYIANSILTYGNKLSALLLLLSPAVPKETKGDYKIVSVRPSVRAFRPSARISQKLLGQFPQTQVYLKDLDGGL